MAENKVKFMLFRLKKMSKEGFNRLSSRIRLNFKKEVYIPIGRRFLDTDKVYDEYTLAKWLILKEGVGKYCGCFWKQDTRKLGKQAFKVEIWGNINSKWGYEFEHTTGIARYGFWISDF